MTFSPPPKQNTAVLIQCATDDFLPLLDVSEARHRAYAARHGMDFWQVRERAAFPGPARPCHWDRLWLIRQAMADGYDFILYLDADTLVCEDFADPRLALPPGACLGMVRELRGLYNAGVLFVRNTPAARDFFDRAWDSFPPPGPFHEQSALGQHLPSLAARFAALPAAWNYCPKLTGDMEGGPFLRAWHFDGSVARRLDLMRAESARLDARDWRDAAPLSPLPTPGSLRVQVAVCGGLPFVRECVGRLLANTEGDFHLHFFDNGSDPETARFLSDTRLADPRVLVTRSPVNLGFGEAHNRMMQGAGQEFVCVLNSDCLVAPGWNRALMETLAADAKIGAAGRYLSQHSGTPYLQGDCLMLRTPVAVAFGPFDTAQFPVAYGEDSDLSARLTRAGYRLAAVPGLGVRHLGSSLTRTALEEGGLDLSGILAVNNDHFRRRWPRPARRSRIVVRRRGALGDVLCCTPLLRHLAQEDPGRLIVFETFCPDGAIGNPHIADLRWIDTEDKHADLILDRASENDYHLDPSRPARHLCEDIALEAGVTLTDLSPVLCVQDCERAWARVHLPARYLCLAWDTGWRTRNWGQWLALARSLRRETGLTVVLLGTPPKHLPCPIGGQGWELGAAGIPNGEGDLGPARVEEVGICDLRGRTTLRQAFGILAGASAFAGCDSGMAHAAGALSVPSVVLGGAIDAGRRIHAGQVALNTSLACAGCFHRQSSKRTSEGIADRFTYCARESSNGKQPLAPIAPCMRQISERDVRTAFLALPVDWKEARRAKH